MKRMKVTLAKVKMFGVDVPVVKVRKEMIFFYDLKKYEPKIKEFEEIFGEGIWEEVKEKGRIELEVSESLLKKLR